MTGQSLEQVRADLARRVAAMNARAPRARARELATEVDAIRAAARRAGLHPVVTVAHLLNDALSRGERGALIHGWLHVLGDAVRCDRSDPDACRAYAAACAVRVDG